MKHPFKLKMVEAMFDFMERRHTIYLDRKAGKPWPWTKDPVLLKWKFTNVYRELDKTTVWFRENVRDPLRNDFDKVIRATIIFRWFNRIETGEILRANSLLIHWDRKTARRVLKGLKPLVTGAYMIKTPTGKDKLEGMLDVISSIEKKMPYIFDYFRGNPTLEACTEHLREYPFMGPFLAFEVVTDLRHTCVLEKAWDIRTWANPGPGAMRGMNRLTGKPVRPKRQWPREAYIQMMQELLSISLSTWPKTFPPLEMRDIEHSLCEFDKYMRAKTGQGEPKAVYHHE